MAWHDCVDNALGVQVIIVTTCQVGGFFVLDKGAKKSIISPSDRMVGYWILG
jgi:hypothetical protein